MFEFYFKRCRVVHFLRTAHILTLAFIAFSQFGFLPMHIRLSVYSSDDDVVVAVDPTAKL